MPELNPIPLPQPKTHSFGLEQAEVEMLLALKQEEGLAFDAAVRSAVCASGNEVLFAFPEDRFEIPAQSVWAVLLHTGSEDACIYIYECSATGDFCIASNDDLNPSYLSFARAHASVMALIATSKQQNEAVH